MVWIPDVDTYEFENSTEHTAMNKPVFDLIARTDWLKQQVDQITAGRNLVGLYDNVDTTVVVGDTVYLETSTGTVKKALSQFASAYAADGSLRLNESAYVLGIVTEKPNATSAYVWTTGTFESQALADAALGVSADPGTYRLSMTNDGELTLSEQELDVLVVQYQGNGVMVMFDKRAAIPNHIHQSYTLAAAWLAESDTQFDDMEKPLTALWGYDLASDPDMQRIFSTIPGIIRIYGDGVLLLETALSIYNNVDNLWSDDVTSPAVTYTTLEAVITIPYSFGEPVLRGARSDTPSEIVLSALQGILTANMVPWTYDDVQPPTGFAVMSLNGRQALRSPVVVAVEVAGNLQKQESSGTVTISDGAIGTFLEPQNVNLNNAIEANDGFYTYFSLPAGRDAFMLGRISLPYFTGTLKAAVIAEVYGLSVGGAIPALAVSYIAKDYPSVAQSMPSAWDASFTLPTPEIAAGNALIVEADIGDQFAITSKGTVYLKLGFNSPSEDIKIARFGVILYTV